MSVTRAIFSSITLKFKDYIDFCFITSYIVLSFQMCGSSVCSSIAIYYTVSINNVSIFCRYKLFEYFYFIFCPNLIIK